MAGGNFNGVMNKQEPGVYIDVVAKASVNATPGDKGIVAIGQVLDWQNNDLVANGYITITDPNNIRSILGYSLGDSQVEYINQIFMGSNRTPGAMQVNVIPLETTGAANATATLGNVFVSANGIGNRGNDLAVSITPDLSTSYTSGGSTLYAVYTVNTYLAGTLVDSQRIGSYTNSTTYTPADASNLVSNDFVSFGGTGVLTTTALTSLSGGATGTITTNAYSTLLNGLDSVDFDVFCYDGSDSTTATAIANYIKDRTYNQGRWCKAVIGQYAGDDPCINSPVNGIVLNTGVTLTSYTVTWWLAGIEAGCPINMSATYVVHPQATAPSPTLTQDERIHYIKEGYMVFFSEFNQVKLLYDINTLVTLTPTKGKLLQKNRPVRTIWQLCNDLYEIFAQRYIGIVNNNDTGRNFYKTAVVSYLSNLARIGAIEPVGATDVTVAAVPGESDSIQITLAIQIIDSIEKIYITATVTASGDVVLTVG